MKNLTLKKFILAGLLISISIIISSCTTPKPTKTVVVLVDMSESTVDLRQTYLGTIENIISTATYGDTIVVAKITESSITEPDVPIKEVFPLFVAVNASGQVTDNPMLVEKSRKEADAKLVIRKAEILNKAKNFLMPSSGNNKKVMKTDIMGSVSIAENFFKNYKSDEAVLVVLSDMIEDCANPYYDFYQENLTDIRINEIISEEKKSNRLPDLTGVKVYAVAAGSHDTATFFELQNFWLKYFKDCGADASKDNYSNTLIKIK